MWQFPSFQAFIANNLVAFVFTLFTLFLTVLGWAYFISAARGKNKRTAGKTGKYLSIAVLTTLGLSIIGGYLVSGYAGDARPCRSLDLDRVEAVRVRQMPSENLAGSKTVLFADAGRIREGLALLKNAASRGRKKKRGAPAESFGGGYRLELVLAGDAPGPVVYYFSAREKAADGDVVIPHCAADAGEIDQSDDIYSSVEFAAWVDAHIKPLFKDAF